MTTTTQPPGRLHEVHQELHHGGRESAGERAVVAAHARFPALDGLRAVAVLAVVMTHSAYITGRYSRGPNADMLARFDSGVAIFFVLSGFLLVRPWLAAAATGGPSPSIGTYARRRFFRIWPAYAVAVAIALLGLPENRTSTVWDWVHHLLLVQIYRAGWLKEGLTQCWSLATEASFYAVLPLLGWAMVVWTRRTGWSPVRLLIFCGVLIAIPVAWHLFLHETTVEVFAIGSFWLPSYIGWFAGGMAIAVVHTHLHRHPPHQASSWWVAERLGQHPLTCWALAIACFALTLNASSGPRGIVTATTQQAITKENLYLVMAVLLVWPAVFGQHPLTLRLLANRVVRYAGDISYGVFLYHLAILHTVMRVTDTPMWTGSALVALALTLLVTVPVAAVSFRYLETPLIAYAHRPSARASDAPAAGEPAPRTGLPAPAAPAADRSTLPAARRPAAQRTAAGGPAPSRPVSRLSGGGRRVAPRRSRRPRGRHQR